MTNPDFKLWKSSEPLSVGMYAMHGSSSTHKSLVRIRDQFKSGRYGVEYVSLRRNGTVYCGGGSFSHSLETFSPLTESWQILVAEYYESKRQEKEATEHAKNMAREADIRLAAISALVRSGTPAFDNCGSPISVDSPTERN